MIPVCIFLSDNPIVNDVYSNTGIKYVCRCAERLQDMKQYSDRFVTNSISDCDKCRFYIADDTSNSK